MTVRRWWEVPSATPRGWRGAGALTLLVGLVALATPPKPFSERTTWEALVAPYSTGAPLPNGFRIQEIRRGADNGVVIAVRRPADGATVEVVVVARGRWKSVHESQSFTIDYELPRSSAGERDIVTAIVADTIRSRDHGLPSPDAVPLGAADLTVLPWWLETLRGVGGMLVGATLVLLALIALLRSSALAGVGVALGVIDVAARLAGVPALRPDLGAVWTLSASALLLFVALRGWRSRRPVALLPCVGVATTAVLLRLALGPWGPLHVNGHGPRFVAGAAGDPADIAAYGPGYSEIFAPVAALGRSSPDWAIFACNALFSALVCPLALVIGFMTGLTAPAAFIAAMLIAIDPIAIRMGATEAYFAPIAFFCTSASAAMLLALDEIERDGRSRAAAILVAAGLLLSQAARIHPSAWLLMATVPFVILAGDAGTWKRRIFVLLAAAAISGGLLLFTSASVLLDVLGNIRTGTVFRPPPPSPAPLVWVAAATAAYAVLAPRRWLALPAAISVAAIVLTRHAFEAGWIWQQAYSRLYLTLPVIAAIACLPLGLLRNRWVAVAAALVVVVGWVRFGWPIITARTMDHLEYRWVREELRRLPAGCRVVYLASAGKRVLMLPTYVHRSRAVPMHPHLPQTMEAAFAPAPCLYYVHTSLCSTPDARRECEAIERRLTLVPIARASFPAARQSETYASHDTDMVETMIARVDHVDGGETR